MLLSGGKGKRLWPASTDKVPKQFIKVFFDASSMLSKTYNLVLKNVKEKRKYMDYVVIIKMKMIVVEVYLDVLG